MQIVINIEKKHLAYFVLFLFLGGGIYLVQASAHVSNTVPDPGHGLDGLGPGAINLDNSGFGPILLASDEDPVLKIEQILDAGDSISVAGDIYLRGPSSGSDTQSTLKFQTALPVATGGSSVCVLNSGGLWILGTC